MRRTTLCIELPLATLLAWALLLARPAHAEDPPSCTFGPGALPADTLPSGSPHGAQIPIYTTVVLMQENRSFDHYFGRLPYAAGYRQVDGLPRDTSSPNPLGGDPIKPFHQKHMCEVADLNHSWSGTHREWNGGAMDGFTAENVDPADPSGSRAMGFYLGTDLPFYYSLYKKFAIGDRFFCSVLSQTFPNRFYLLTGTSFGHIRNDFPSAGGFTQPSIFGQLDDAGVSWKIYYGLFPFGSLFADAQGQTTKIRPIAEFFTDAAAGMLPQVVFVDPIFIGAKNVEDDEHPPANVQVGQEFVSRVVNALFASPLWQSSALFITYDEHGGFYDHVPPPPACLPDGIPPNLLPSDEPGAFDRLGIRVPVVVVSPFARKHFVSHVVHDLTSILRFIQTRFDLPALTARDANADPMLEFFDFQNPPFLKPPTLRKARVSESQKDFCDALDNPDNSDL